MTADGRLAVAAGILLDAGGRVLLCERIGASPLAGLWEFPGGKIDDGETAADALARELAEELGIAVHEAVHFMSVEHDYPHSQVALEFYLVRSWEGKPRGLDGQGLAWREPSEIDAAELLPANAPVLERLRDLEQQG